MSLPNYDSHTEKELLNRLSDGDEGAFEKLFNDCWDHVYSTALLMTKSPQMADDISQDAFYVVWKERAKMSLVLNIRGFLYTQVKFLVHKRLRRLHVEDAYRQYQLQRTEYVNITDERDSTHLTQLQNLLRDGIDRLPDQQRRAFRMSRELGLSHEEISVRMGLSKKTVKDYIVRSLAFLRNHLREFGYLLYLGTISLQIFL